MGMEFRVAGPPGTGKTTWMAIAIARAAEKQGSDSVMVTSFTRAAAAALVGHDLPIPRSNVGTLHALCYRALDRPIIAETKTAEWNTNVMGAFQLSVKGDEHQLDDPLAERLGAQSGDEIMRKYQILRNRLAPREMWPEDVRAFDGLWRKWKDQTGYEDFTGMLERALDLNEAPGNPRVIFLDEAQDCVPLQWAVLRKWANACDTFVLAGDDDQCIYSFVGASPDLMLDPPVPEEQMRILHQSYRVPRAVLDLSQNWIKQVGRRWRKDYLPRANGEEEVIGEVKHTEARWRNGDGALPLIEKAMKSDHTIMILASCAYMLQPTIASLRSHGIPFHNPYRYANGSWNPLHVARGTSVRERLLAYLRPQTDTWGENAHWWTWKDVHDWAGLLKVRGVFKPGGQSRLDIIAKSHGDEVSDVGQLLAEVFEEEALGMAFEQDIDWLRSNMLAVRAKSAEFPLEIIKAQGSKALLDTPRVMVGTIHSVKGGEADEVLVYPDLSTQGLRQWISGGEQADSVRRMFYVGMTRTKYVLHLGTPTVTTMSVEWGG